MSRAADGAPIPGEDPIADDSYRVWQQVPPDLIELPPDFFQERLAQAIRANRRLRLLRSVQHIGTLGGFLCSTVVAVMLPGVPIRAGSIGLALTFLYRWRLLRRTPAVPDGAGPPVNAEPLLVAYRAALVQRIADDSGAQLWSRLAIAVPATALVLYGIARSYPRLIPVVALETVAIAIGLSLAFASAVRRARRCQAELDAVDALMLDDTAPG